MKNIEKMGLTSEQAEESRRLHGANVLTPPQRESVWKLFVGKFDDPIIKVLLAAALLSLAVACIEGEFAETIGIFSAIFLATGVAFWFEYDAMRRFEELNKVNDEVAVKAVRDGRVTEIPQRDVVVGDVVILENGEGVPADGELLEAVSLKINESTLTGEPEVDKSTDPARFDVEATYPTDRAMKGTTVVDGYCVMRVTAVGDGTEFGRVATQSAAESEEPTPLSVQLTRLSKVISRVGIALSVLIFAALLIRDAAGGLFSTGWVHIARNMLEYFMVSVAVAVMAIPEGLPMSITLSLAMSMRRMLKTNNLVRKMHACETMGAVTVICTDKTGTLTCNQMRVSEMVCYADERTLHRAVACNTTAFVDEEGRVAGNPTEGALLLWLGERGGCYAALRSAAVMVDRMPFTTERKYMATLVEESDGRRWLYVKGAPEIVRAMCAVSDREERTDARLREFQSRAMRTLAVACTEVTGGESACEEVLRRSRLSLLAVAAIADPVRDDVPAAVRRCLDAGIAVKMVTGDTTATATEIARRIGLWDDACDGERQRMTGAEFAALGDEELLERVGELKIVSRARPLDKQRLVQLLQRRGEIVAVTGDGTNDAPALNFAHVGLSMGSGTSVAREASDITLLDDSFSSIATAVMWGRSLYRNIQRFVLFQLTVNFTALSVVFVGALLGEKMPLTVTQILWVNLIMDTFAAMALASLPPNPRVMNERPRRNSDFIIDRGMTGYIFGFGTLFVAVLVAMLVCWRAEIADPAVSVRYLTLFFTTFVLLQFWNMFNAKGFGDRGSALSGIGRCRGFLSVLGIIAVGQVLIVTFGGEVFRTRPLSAGEWLTVAAATSLVLWTGEALRLSRTAKRERRRNG